jgi:hypothetical protein
MILQLNPSIPVYICSKNVTGECVGWIDYSKEDDLLWIVALDTTGEVWIEPNNNIRLLKNYSIGRIGGTDGNKSEKG